MSNKNIKRAHIAQYSFIALPLAFAGMPLYIYAPDFYATQFGVSLATIGLLLLGLRFFDAIQDPIIGKLSDLYATKRHVIIACAGLLLVLGFMALFQPMAESSILLWFTISMVLATTGFSIISINLNTLGGLWSKDTYQKTRITSSREALGLIGLLFAILLPAILQKNMTAPIAFYWVSLIVAVLMCLGIIIFSLWYQNYPDEKQNSENPKFTNAIKDMPKNMKAFFAAYAISILASSIPAILVLFFIRDLLKAESLTGIFLLAYFLSGAVGMLIWQKISSTHDKTRAWLLATLLSIASFIWVYFLGEGDLWQYGIICIISGLAFGADLALPPSILADHIQENNMEPQASLQFGIFAFISKSALAIASVIALPLLDNAGFKPGEINSAESLWVLSLIYSAIPCAIKLLAAALLWRMINIKTQNGENNEIHLSNSNDRNNSNA